MRRPPSPQELVRAIKAAKRRREAEELPKEFSGFVRGGWDVLEPGRRLVWNWHLDAISEHLQAVVRGELLRLLINIPPRCMKSLQTNVFLQPWVWTSQPHLQFVNFSHSEKLAVRDSLKSRRIITSPWYQERWGDKFRLTSDQNEKKRYENDHNGHRIAMGLQANITGEGGDIVIIDDPHDAKKAQSDKQREDILDIWDDTLTSRLNDQVTGAFIVIMQRLHEKDLAGHLLEKGGWEHLCLPMEYDPKHPFLSVHDPRKKPGELLWPERFPARIVERFKADLSAYAYSGQHQQLPTPAAGGIIKKSYWKRWGKGEAPPFLTDGQKECWEKGIPPQVIYKITTADTAFEEDKEADYSAFTTWGIFVDARGIARAILLSAVKGQWEYPELRREAKAVFDKHKPDLLLIEKKASGNSLWQDLARSNMTVLPYDPGARSKVLRAHIVTHPMEAGRVFAPERDWADAVIEECAAFPRGAHDDYVDCVTMALQRLMDGHWVASPADEDDDEDKPERKRGSRYGRQ